MEKAKAAPSITDLQGLELEADILEQKIAQSDARVATAAKELVSFDAEWVNGKLTKSTPEHHLNMAANPAERLLPNLFAELIGKTILKKTGFVKRLILKQISKVVLRKGLMAVLKTPDAPKRVQMKTINPATFIEQSDKDVWIGDMEANQEEQSPVRVEQKKLTFSGIFSVLKKAFEGFSDHKVTKLSGSLAYYTIFSMAPLMIVIISLMSIFLSREAAEGQVYQQLKGFLGPEPAKQVQDLIKNAAISGKGTIAFIVGAATLLIGATTVFADIQDSINYIWGIKPKPKRGWLKLLKNRFLSFSVIISLGFLLLVSLGISTLLDNFSGRLQMRFSHVSVIVFYVINLFINLLVISAIFGVIFRVLPDASIRWKDVILGAMVTAVLFMLGKLAISLYISKTDISGTFGATGSLVILLLWTYYSSIILYFGAEFTRAYALAYGSEIHPDSHAVSIREVEVEQGQASLQQVNDSAKSGPHS